MVRYDLVRIYCRPMLFMKLLNCSIKFVVAFFPHENLENSPNMRLTDKKSSLIEKQFEKASIGRSLIYYRVPLNLGHFGAPESTA